MTAREVLRLNGNFRESPLLDTLKRLDALLTSLQIPYAVVGSLAVVRNGAVRTTVYIDILTTREGWSRVMAAEPAQFEVRADQAVDTANRVDVDVLFPGDDWQMVIPLPQPEQVREYDQELYGWFIDLLHLLELKTAVYLKKLGEDGIEDAAKDLADVVALIENNAERITAGFVARFQPAVRSEFSKILRNVRRKRG